MAKALMGLGQLKVEFAKAYVAINDIHILDQANEHGVMRLELTSKGKLTVADVLPLEDAPVKVTDSDGAPIFVGICQNVELCNESDYSELILNAKSLSVQTDRKRHSRTFQNPGKTLQDVADAVMAPYGLHVAFDRPIAIEAMLYQNDETDWQFLRRIVNQCGLYLFTDSKATELRIAAGLVSFGHKPLGAESRVTGIVKDIGKCQAIQGNLQSDASAYEYEQALRSSYDLTIGAGYTVECPGEPTRWSEISEISVSGQAVDNHLTLAYPEGCRPNRDETAGANNHSDYLKGIILAVQGTKVKVHFDCDQEQDPATARWIDYENAMNNYLYSMPDVGDTVFVYYENNGKLIALGSHRSDDGHRSDGGSNNPDYEDTSNKSLTSAGNLFRFAPGAAEFVANRTRSGNYSELIMSDQDGILINSKQDLLISSDQTLLVQAAGQKVQQTTFAQFKAEHAKGQAAYISCGGTAAPDANNELLNAIGLDVGKTFQSGQPFYVGQPTALSKEINEKLQTEDKQYLLDNFNQEVKNSILTFPSLNNATSESDGGNSAPAAPPQVDSGALRLQGMDHCQLCVGNSVIDIKPDIMQIDTPVFRQLGFQKASHSLEPPESEEAKEMRHTAYGWLSCIPFLGIPFALDDAYHYYKEGRSFMAGVAVICAIPGGGEVKMGAKIGAKIGLGVVEKLGGKELIEKGAAIVTKYLEKGENLGKNAAAKAAVAATEAVAKTYASLAELIKSSGITKKLVSGAEAMIKEFKNASAVSKAIAESVGKALGHKLAAVKQAASKAANKVAPITEKIKEIKDKIVGKLTGKKTCAGEPVDVVTGSFFLRMTDLRLPDLGGDFRLIRNYESLCTNRQQPLGERWLLNLGVKLQREDEQVTLLMDDHHLERFRYMDGQWVNKRGGDQSLRLTQNKDGWRLDFMHTHTAHRYDDQGRLTHQIDQNGNTQTIVYLGSQIKEVRLANGQVIQFAYHNNKLIRVTDGLDRSVTYTYQGELLTAVTYPNNGTIRYQYTEEGWLSHITDQNGVAYLTNHYDHDGRILRQDMQKNGEYVFFYQDDDRTTTVTSSHNNRAAHYLYNRQKLVIKITHADGTTEEKNYDDKENILWEKDRNGQETRYSYNEASQVTETIHPNGLITQYTYDQAGNLIQETDNSGLDIRYSYDQHHNLLEKKQRLDSGHWQTTAYTYDAKGRNTAVTDSNGHTRRYAYEQKDAHPWELETAAGDHFRYEYDPVGRLMVIESSFGRREFGYNHIDRKTLDIDALGNTWRYDYDNLGNLTKEIRPNQYNLDSRTGLAWQRRYDAMDEQELLIDPLGNTIATLRDAEENIIKEIHPNAYDAKTNDGAGIRHDYDVDNRKIRSHYPDGGIERNFYDPNGNLIKKVLPEHYDLKTDDGIGYTYAYDAGNRLTTITNPDGIVEKAYVYDLAGRITKEIDAIGYAEGDSNDTRPGICHRYNLAGWLMETNTPVRNNDGQIRCQTVQYCYDNAGNVVEERRFLDEQDPTGAGGRLLSLRFSYDEQNRLVKVEDNTGAVIQYTYNCLNQRTMEKRKINDNAYELRRYHYDDAGRLIAVEQRADKEGCGLLNVKTEYQLDKTGNVVQITTPAGYVIQRQYDAADRLIAEIHKDKTSGIDNKNEFSYDKAGNLTQITDNNGTVETFEYDLLNRQIKHIGKNGGVTRTKYDKNGRISKKILPNQYQEKGEEGAGYAYTYDHQGRVITILAPNGHILQTNSYDQAGRLIQRRDATDSGVDYSYDLAGRVEIIQTLGGASQSYEYDARGNITGVCDGNKNKTKYHLDAWGRITHITKADGTTEAYAYDCAGNITETTDGEGHTIQYQYNLINKLKEITDPTGKTDSFLYDVEGQLKNHTDRNGNQVEYSHNLYNALTEKHEKNSGLRESYEYHPDGSLKAAIAQGMRYAYSYYADGRLKEKTASGRVLLGYAYDLNGNPISQTDVTGKTTEFSYNDLDLLTEVCENGNRVAGYEYNLDGTVQALHNGSALTTSYAYDSDKNLTGLEVLQHGNPLVQNQYQYDGNGNRTVKEQLKGITNYTYDSLNQLTKVQYPDYAEELVYDRVGNRTKRMAKGQEEQYAYDSRNRLTSHIQQGQTTQYQYDPAGNLLQDGDKHYTYDGFNRTTKVATNDGQVQVNRYDAEGLRHEMEENGKLVQFIFNQNREIVVETSDAGFNRLIRSHELLSSSADYASTYYHYASDELGSITHVTDNDGQVLNHYEYDAFGNILEQTEMVANRFKYTGQQLDPVTQQYYLRARFYNPIIARFTQEDTYRGDGLNLYAYCANNPVMYVDPSGYACEPGAKDVNKPPEGPNGTPDKGLSGRGYKPQPGERTFDGYVKDNAKPEVSLNTKSSGFNNNSRTGTGGEFKRFGAESHAGLSPHVHQPQRNVNVKTGEVYGNVGVKTGNGGVTSPTEKDIKQLFDHLNNGKYSE